ncbi:MAG: type II toxin-antitoxin system VapC family toxin [Candidatus Limnocylindrales bacterium]
MYYLDTSAAAKLILSEPDSSAMRLWAESHDAELSSSDVLRAELHRAVRRHVPQALARVPVLLGTIVLSVISAELWERAARIEPPRLRTLDALHLAAAMDLGSDLDAIVTYDERLAEAARANGIATLSPR